MGKEVGHGLGTNIQTRQREGLGIPDGRKSVDVGRWKMLLIRYK